MTAPDPKAVTGPDDVMVNRRALRLLLERVGVNPASTANGLRAQLADLAAPRG
jgi:hypothetical protein